MQRTNSHGTCLYAHRPQYISFVPLSLQAEAYRLQLARFYELLVEQKAPRGTAPRIAGLRNICKELRKVGRCAPANPNDG